MKSKFVLAQVSSSGDVAANLEKAKKMMARAYEDSWNISRFSRTWESCSRSLLIGGTSRSIRS